MQPIPPAEMTAAIEETRRRLIQNVLSEFDKILALLNPHSEPQAVVYRHPTLADGQNPLNKAGHNLTDRGVEILYRMFDADAGYNRASKMLGITQAAAKNRKSMWLKIGGKDRKKLVLDIDQAG